MMGLKSSNASGADLPYLFTDSEIEEPSYNWTGEPEMCGNVPVTQDKIFKNAPYPKGTTYLQTICPSVSGCKIFEAERVKYRSYAEVGMLVNCHSHSMNVVDSYRDEGL